MAIEGVLPDRSEVEEGSEEEVKLPEFIPSDSIYTIRDEDDVDAFPRGAMAYLPTWDEDLAMDLMVAGAAVTLLDRASHAELATHDDFDPDGFGILDDGLWLPGMDAPYQKTSDGWRLPA